MGDVISFKQARKARDRRQKEIAADANRALHGRTKAERAAAMLDGAKREE